MRKFRVLYRLLKTTGAGKKLLSYIVYVLIVSFIIFITDPGINTYGDALWYNYAVLSTVGFGDVLASTALTRILSVTVTAYSILVIAIITGVVVTYYNQIVEMHKKDALTSFLKQLENLPECSKEELEVLSRKVRRFNNNNRI